MRERIFFLLLLGVMACGSSSSAKHDSSGDAPAGDDGDTAVMEQPVMPFLPQTPVGTASGVSVPASGRENIRIIHSVGGSFHKGSQQGERMLRYQIR